MLVKEFVICTITILLILGVTSCKTYRQADDEGTSRYYEYSEKDLNLLIAIDYIQRLHGDCKNDICRIAVRGVFESYNKCFAAYYPDLVEKTRYDFDHSIRVVKGVDIPNWGSISFVGTIEQQYNFAPVLVDRQNGVIHGQVMLDWHGLTRFQEFSYYVIGDNIYFAGDYFFHDGSCFE